MKKPHYGLKYHQNYFGLMAKFMHIMYFCLVIIFKYVEPDSKLEFNFELIDKPAILSTTCQVVRIKTISTSEFAEFLTEIKECQELISMQRTKSLMKKITETPCGEGECIICQNTKENTVLTCSVFFKYSNRIQKAFIL